MAKRTGFQTVSILPLSGVLDTRSRPADIPPGAFRMKQNWQVSDEGKLCRGEGFTRFFHDALYDNLGEPLTDPNHKGTGVFYHNHDHHHQGATREPITMLFESTGSDGTRRLFDGTESRIALLNPDTGYWTDIATGMGGGNSRWKAAELQDTVIFVNNVNDPLSHALGSNTTQPIPDLQADNITAVRFVIQFNGFIVLMNMVQAGKRQSTRIRWSDLNLPLSYAINPATSLAGFQDLDYGDDILAAAPLLGALYIFTRRSIWRMTVSGGAQGGGATQTTFAFLKVYNEPKAQTGCLLYENTLVSDGDNCWYGSRDGIYNYNPYLPQPERQDWLHRADGLVFRNAITALSGVQCQLPVCEYRSTTRELWFSWPSGTLVANNLTLRANLLFKTADLIDHGFWTFGNFRPTPTLELCNENQSFLGVSTADWTIKDTGGVFLREMLQLVVKNDPTLDPPLNAPDAIYFTLGYNSILRGMVPLGLTDRDKIVRDILIDHDTTDQDKPCVIRTRVGTSFDVRDPNDADDVCAVFWTQLADQLLACNDGGRVSQMQAKGIRPNSGTSFPCYVQGRFIYYEIIITNADKSPAIGGDSCFQRLDFEALALPRP